MTIAGPGPELFRPALEGLVPYEPGKPAELVQRELGLDHVVKLASLTLVSVCFPCSRR